MSQTEEGAGAQSVAEKTGKYLTFRLQDEEYGLEIMKVREIIGLTDITSVPRTPEYVAGVTNLRGKVIPVVDLRLKFGMAQGELTEQTCIIVVEVNTGKGAAPVGIIVDTVNEVVDIPDEDIEAAPELGGSVDTEFIFGIGKVKETIKILLDIDTVLNVQEIREARGEA